MSRKVLISGGTGLIGSHLKNALTQQGYEVGILSRSPAADPGARYFEWDPGLGTMDGEAIRWADAIIHLAGAGIAEKRWTPARKQLIMNSRIQAGDLLFKTLQAEGKQLEAFVAASAIGYYGAHSTQQIFTEEDPPANDFQGLTCQKWEAASQQVASLGTRTVILRVGVVLSKTGGALSKMALPVRLFVGSPLGSGRQYIPWIHIDDISRIFIRALEDQSLSGAHNAVAPEAVTNREFTKTLARVLKRPLLLPPVPALVLKLLLGEMSEVILEGSRVSPDKLQSTGFTFLYPELGQALTSCLG